MAVGEGAKEGISVAGYSNYYQRGIDENDRGIKLVLGPTGLGKSSSIPDVVRNNPDHKFIYQANRKELLQEMAARFSPGEFVLLQRDLEVVQKMLTTQQHEFDKLLADPRFANALKQAKNKTHLKSLETVAIHRACKQVLEITSREGILPDWLEKHADSQARIILQAVRLVIQMTRDKNEQGAVYTWLVSHPVVETLFPAIAFRRRPEVRIMLVTLHKAYYGFFDGAQIRSLTDLSAQTNAIIFLDEFDFLENDLVKLICRVPQISDPFDFVACFYRAMAFHKLPKQDFPLHPNIRERIKKIVTLIENIRTKGLDYPNINQFTLAKTPTKRAPAIFRTNRTISTTPLFINQTTRSYQLETKKSNQAWATATWFFHTIGLATTLILALFKELERDNEGMYWELMRQCFRNTDFFEQVISIPRLPQPQQAHSTQRSSLLQGGYNLFEINDLQQRSDNEEVEVFFYQMLQTPENLLRILTSKHLIFALSATADIRRCIHHFDLDWLESEGLLLPITDEDRNDIQQLSESKAVLRGQRMNVVQVDGLDTSRPLQARLSDFLHIVVHNDEFDEDAGGYRSQRMHRFFAAFLWLLEHGGDRPRELLFLNSFLQVKLLFTTFARDAKDESIYTIEPLPDTPWFQAFNISIESSQATVVFFNAELAAQVRENEAAKQAFTQLFWTTSPVVVVTQYLSAGNGVNLQYTNEKNGPEQDFTHIGLLEAPYYFFTKPDPIEQDFHEIFAGNKENIWYQAKLFFSKLISEERFRKVLETTNKPFAWNADYQKGTTARDNVLNCLVIFMQALGRIERTWQKISEPQVALLHADVFRIFQAFLHEEFEAIRDQHEPFASTNLTSVLEEVAAQTKNYERIARRKRDGRLYAHNELCRNAIHDLVRRLEIVRSQEKDVDARRDWENLRYAVLRHDFHADIITRYFCTTSSPYYSKGKLNIILPELAIFPLDVLLPESKVMTLDAMYTTIAGNHVIQEHFAYRGFDLKFDHPGTHFFTPYCLQAILAGAIGEEAVTALLAEAGILVEALPNPLFEVVDQKIVGKPWFIDCKNYNDHTLDRFSLPIGDPLRHPTLNEAHFMQSAKGKLQRITQHSGQGSKLIYINLVSGQERPLGYYNNNFQEVSTFDTAEIIVVQAALDRQAPNFFQAAFTTFLADLKKALKLVEENDLT